MGQDTQLRDGRYVLRGRLGEGAQGITFDAVDVRDGRAVAIKRFDVQGARSWKEVELAEREARVLQALDHPYLPRYVDHFEEGGALHLVMEKVEGETLDAIIRREGALSEKDVRRLLACADHAFTYLHGRSAQTVHRDVKPRNIIRRPDGSYVFVDFGAVSEKLRPRGGSTIVGTYGYMAPEQLQGRALPATDIYAVGATAVAALSGIEPEALPHRGLRIDVRAALAGRASANMISALEQMLEPDPDRRAASIGPLLETAPSEDVRIQVAPSTTTTQGESDVTIARSISKLLWVLWGLGWVILGPTLKQMDVPRLIVPLMFSWLAATLIVTHRKGALLQVAIRALRREAAQAGDASKTTADRWRVETQDANRRVRVQRSEMPPDEAVAPTEVSVARQARR